MMKKRGMEQKGGDRTPLLPGGEVVSGCEAAGIVAK